MARGSSLPGQRGSLSLSFVGVFVIGAALILICRILFPRIHVGALPMGTVLGALAAVAVMVLHGWQACQKSGRGEEISHAGDDLYYLGLLFTLVSLIYTLIALFILGGVGDTAARTHELIGSFGIALFSTVAGILGRVILHSMRDWQGEGASSHGTVIFIPSVEPESADRMGRKDGIEGDPEQPPDHGEDPNRPGPSLDPPPGSANGGVVTVPFEELDFLARRLRAEMRGAADAFSHYSRLTLLQAENTKLHAEQMANQLTGKLNEATAATVANTEEIYRKWAGRVDSTSHDLERRFGRTVGDLAALVERLGSVADSFRGATAGAEQTQGAVEALGRSVAAVTDDLDRNVGNIVTALETLAVKIGEQQEATAHDLEKTRAITEQTQSGFEATGQVLKAATGALDRLTDHMLRTSEGLARSAVEQRDSVDQYSAKVEALGKQMDDVLTGWARRAEHMSETFRAMNETADTHRILIEQMGRLNEALAEMNEALAEMNDHLETRPGWPWFAG